MNKKYKQYLQYLASNHNLLYIGHDKKNIYKNISSYFMSSSKIDFNNEILDKLSGIIAKRHIDIVIFDAKNNDEIFKKFFHGVKLFKKEILTMLIFNQKEQQKLFEILPLADAIISYPLDKDLFYKRLFGVLSMPYAVKSIAKKDVILQKNNIKQNSIDEFFDIYEGSSLFISDELLSMVENINNGNLSHNFLTNIALKMDEIADIFSKNKKTVSIINIFIEFSNYLKELKLDTIHPKNLIAFDYLADILKNISIYLLDIFVDKIFENIYLFKNSLKNNIKNLQNKLENNNEKNKKEISFLYD